MPLLTVPNWSLGRERTVLREAFDFLDSAPVTVHYAEADIDHNRTVTAFSGTPANVQSTLLALAEIFLPCINLQRHTGVHPRIGGLDVCPFIPLPNATQGVPPFHPSREGTGGRGEWVGENTGGTGAPLPLGEGLREGSQSTDSASKSEGSSLPSRGGEGVGWHSTDSGVHLSPGEALKEGPQSANQPPPQDWGGIKGGVDENMGGTGKASDPLNEIHLLHAFINETAQLLADAHQIPIFLYEHSAPGKSLPNLRKGGFGGLLNQELRPDFGPNKAHQYLGATVLDWRDFLVALNVNFPNSPGAVDTMKHIADKIREKRRGGDPQFAGVRALGLELQAQEIAQLSMNITAPDATDFDAIITYIEEQAGKAGINDGYSQLIGVIRDTDIERSTKIFANTTQIVQTRLATNWQEDWPKNP